jgi:hypothetical protein
MPHCLGGTKCTAVLTDLHVQTCIVQELQDLRLLLRQNDNPYYAPQLKALEPADWDAMQMNSWC